MLQNWKTYIVVIIGVIFNGLVAMGYIPESARETVNSILVFLGLGALKSAVKKVSP